MRTLIHTLVLIVSTSLFSAAQTATTPPASKAAAAEPPPSSTPAGESALHAVSQGSPIGVENFIGLADGSKDWTSPVSHAKKHGVPLYERHIFHARFPNS